MSYEADLAGLEVPTPHSNIQITPYSLYINDRRSRHDTVHQGGSIKIGLDAKWAFNTHAQVQGRDNIQATDFSVFRYQQNYGAQNNTGLFLTNKYAETLGGGCLIESAVAPMTTIWMFALVHRKKNLPFFRRQALYVKQWFF